MQRPPLVERGR